MGCSRGLMNLINRVSVLASKIAKVIELLTITKIANACQTTRTRSLTAEECSQYTTASAEIDTALFSVKQNLPWHSADREDLYRVAKVKQLAALLYLHERLGAYKGLTLAPWINNPQAQNTTTEPQREQFIDEIITACTDLLECTTSMPETADSEASRTWTTGRYYKHRLISLMIQLISTLPDMPTLLWPLFVLGNAGLDDEVHRRFVLDRLANIQKARNLGSIRRATVAVKHAFMRRDLCHSRQFGNPWGHKSFKYLSLA